MAHFSMIQFKKLNFEGVDYLVTVSGDVNVTSVDGYYSEEPDSWDCPGFYEYEITDFEYEIGPDDIEIEDIERLDGEEVDEDLWDNQSFRELLADEVAGLGLTVGNLDDDDELVDMLREIYLDDDDDDDDYYDED